METVIVTGGLGFIFSHFIELLLKNDYKVINIDKVTYASNVNFKPDHQNYTFIKTDICTLNDLPHCDYIVHAASESHVDRSIANSDPFIASNILGTYRILELLKNKKIEHMQMGWEYKEPVLIYIGTDEVLGEIENGFFKEDDRHAPGNPYACTKSCAEMLVKAWGRTYNLPYRITRTTNNYGERQHSEKLIPMCITKCLNNERMTIQGTGEYIRNWIYVKDNCEAVMRVLENGKNGETYHISSDEEYSVVQIVNIILNALGKEWNDKTVEFVQNRSGQDIRYSLDNSKIKNELNWQPKHKMKDVLSWIIKDYENAKLLQKK